MIEDALNDPKEEFVDSDRPKIIIEFNDVASSEYSIWVDPKTTANQMWVVARFLDFWAEQVHQEKRLANQLAQHQQKTEQPKLFIPNQKLTKPN